MRPSQPLLVKMVVVRALRNNFFINGHLATVGEEAAWDISDATIAARAGRVEILGPAPSRVIPVADLQAPPPRW